MKDNRLHITDCRVIVYTLQSVHQAVTSLIGIEPLSPWTLSVKPRRMTLSEVGPNAPESLRAGRRRCLGGLGRPATTSFRARVVRLAACAVEPTGRQEAQP